VLSERERRTLAVMERWLREQDPGFIRRFERAAVTPSGRRGAPGQPIPVDRGWPRPGTAWLLLLAGLLAVLGTAIAGEPVVTLALICALLTGGAVALLVASLRNRRPRRR